MSDSDVVLKVENLSKTYFSKLQLQKSAKDFFVSSFQKTNSDEGRVDALRDVSFELKRGESLGIIGPNGAGKSTLLKILSGVTYPTSGKVTINGRVLSVLDIGTGFHPDLTGRENVFLNGEILGMSRKEIEEKYDEIVEFSGIHEFIDRPVKQYSSGMYLRLAFSIVVSLDADLLLFDEVLAVGDAEFRNKCQRKFRSLFTSQKSLILVSHNMSDIVSYCRLSLKLNNGAVSFLGPPQTATTLHLENSAFSQKSDSIDKSTHPEPQSAGIKTMDNYLVDAMSLLPKDRSVVQNRIICWGPDETRPRNKQMELNMVSVFSNPSSPEDNILITDQLHIELKGKVHTSTNQLSIGFQIMDASGMPLFNSASIGLQLQGSTFNLTATVPANTLNVGLYQVIIATLNDVNQIIYFDNLEPIYFRTHVNSESAIDKYFIGPMRPAITWTVNH